MKTVLCKDITHIFFIQLEDHLMEINYSKEIVLSFRIQPGQNYVLLFKQIDFLISYK